jgi:hypothetical protein
MKLDWDLSRFLEAKCDFRNLTQQVRGVILDNETNFRQMKQ